MLAVHFRAGNRGRGFIGQLIYEAGYEICFVDENSEIINELNQKNSYLILLADDIQKRIKIEKVWGINSLENPEKVIKMIAQADLITTTVGETTLSKIAELIASGLEARLNQNQKPLNIMACENIYNGSTFLKKVIFSYLNAKYLRKINKLIGFPDAMVDRIIPMQNHEDKLLVTVEPFYEWIVEASQIKGDAPLIMGVTYVEDLRPYIERKSFTFNTGHAIIAYMGSYYGLTTIKEAISDQQIRALIEKVLNETGELLIRKYKFNKFELQQYIDTILNRFENEYISDEIARVAHSPISKLGRNGYLIKPARELIKFGIIPTHLTIGIVAALLYENDQDEEAKELKAYLKNHSLSKVISKYTGEPPNSILHHLIIKIYEKLEQF